MVLLTTAIMSGGFEAARAEDKTDNLDRLRSMPLELRQHLAQKIREFDALPSDRQAEIRTLDQRIAELPPADRERYLQLIRRYHLWLQSLPDAKRQAIEQSPPEDRIKLVNQYRDEQRKSNSMLRSSSDWLQVSALSPEPLRRLAIELKFWFSLEPEERQKILRLPNRNAQRTQVEELARERFPQLREFRREQQRRFAAEEEDVKRELAKRFGPGKIPAKREDVFRKIAELRFLQEFDPAPVSIRNLQRFEAAMPPWVRESLDPLPPDAADRRLKVLYRLIFPAPNELPEPKPTTKTQPGTRPSVAPSKPVTPPPTTVTPF